MLTGKREESRELCIFGEILQLAPQGFDYAQPPAPERSRRDGTYKEIQGDSSALQSRHQPQGASE
jgi:hypothetical protein